MERPWKSGSDTSVLSLFQLVLLGGGVEVSFSCSRSSCFSGGGKVAIKLLSYV